MNLNLHDVRVRAELSMAEVARRSGVSTKTVKRMEKNEVSPRPESQWRIYNALRESEEVETLPPFEVLFPT